MFLSKLALADGAPSCLQITMARCNRSWPPLSPRQPPRHHPNAAVAHARWLRGCSPLTFLSICTYMSRLSLFGDALLYLRRMRSFSSFFRGRAFSHCGASSSRILPFLPQWFRLPRLIRQPSMLYGVSTSAFGTVPAKDGEGPIVSRQDWRRPDCGTTSS